MGDHNTFDCSWKKMVIAKANNEWISTLKKEQSEVGIDNTTDDFSESDIMKNEQMEEKVRSNNFSEDTGEEAVSMMQEVDPLMIVTDSPRRRRGSTGKNETPEERKSRLARMSAYAAQRLANETPEQRATRLKRMSDYAAKRLASETHEQRARRLARMSAYAAKRLAAETPEQRRARLTRMSIYAAKRKKVEQKQRSVHQTNFTNKMYS